MRVYQALALLAVAAAPVAAMADNFNLSTGTYAYQVTPPSSSTVTAVPVTPNGAWVLISGASWVAPSSADGVDAAAGLYVYTTTFTLTTLSDLSGSFASDNEASATLTGGTIGSDALGSNTGADSFKTATMFSAVDLGPGTYTLTFDVNNDAGPSPNPTGLIVGASTSTVPEPSSLALLGTGLLSAAGIARRKFFSR